ncbi:MAG: pyridoxal phosphate-dependent aminotransferase [Acholeplasmatales bacterium]|nr:pyridoxal phosphate-dependent aminotransferase [Acholeplasmatales bacterium]
MKYDFDFETQRKNTNSLKWDEVDSKYPLWVADMDFKTAPEITEGYLKRIKEGIFGYNVLNDKFYDSYIDWWDKYHHFKMEKDWIIFSTGVVPSISSAVRSLTKIGDNVVILTPVYNIFFNSIRNNKRIILESPLKYENYQYEIDFDDLEQKLSLEKTSLLIFCNPHNPIGKIWTKDELIKVGNLCKKHNVTVISDEIHCDIVRPGYEYIPFASVSDINKDISVTLIAPTKCFNLAGMQTSAAVVANKKIKALFERGLNTDECAEGNTLAVITPELAFLKGRPWLNEMNEYVFNNRDIVKEYIEKNLEGLHVIDGNATYLAWVDLNGINSKALRDFIYKEVDVYLADGLAYGKTGEGFLRINLATTKKRILEALELIKKAYDKFIENNK